jgi:3-phenylpropionate/trans-cinnamate dioxygenase ferredoxin reductase subunit
MPPLTADDIVYAAGGPAMVEKARKQSEIAGARFYADPFVASTPSKNADATGFERLARIFGAAR